LLPKAPLEHGFFSRAGSLSGGRWPACERATSDPTVIKAL
jgi:hypothetical protein